MNIFKRAKEALTNLAGRILPGHSVNTNVDPDETVKAAEPIKAVQKLRKALKYIFVSTQDVRIPGGRTRRLTATLNVGRNKERRAAGRGKVRVKEYWMGSRALIKNSLRVGELRRTMLAARRTRQLAA